MGEAGVCGSFLQVILDGGGMIEVRLGEGWS